MDMLQNLINDCNDFLDPDSVHDIKHAIRVKENALQIAEGYQVDKQIIELAAILHDIGGNNRETHSELGGNRAKILLEKYNFDAKLIDKVCEIILLHGYNNYDSLVSLESKIVWDADKLEWLGALGVSRSLYYGAERGIPFEEICSWFIRGKEVYSKLHTTEAKIIAKERLEFMLSFSTQLEKESQ